MTEISLKVNEKEIPLNEQMQEMLTNIILGYLKSAKKIPEDKKTIQIKIEF
jgi:hypothetical protein